MAGFLSLRLNKRRIFILTIAFSLFSPGVRCDDYFPKTSVLHYLKYELYINAGQADKALVELILAYQANPKALNLALDIVNLALELKQPGVADIYSEKLLDAKPGDSKVLLGRARLMLSRQKTFLALDLLQKALKSDPQNPDIILELADAHSSLGHKKEAASYLESYLKFDSRNFELWKAKARMELDQKNLKAIESFKEAFGLNPEDPGILEGLIASYEAFSKKSDLKVWLSDFALENPQAKEAKLALCSLEPDVLKQKACLEELIADDPDSFRAVSALVGLLENQSLWEEALELVEVNEALLEHEPYYYLKRSLYLLNLGRDEEALLSLKEGIKKFPDVLEIKYFLALGLEDLGQLAPAAQLLEEIFREKPQWKEASYNYSLVSLEMGRSGKAEEILNNLRRIYPEDATVLNALGFLWAEENKNLPQAKALIEEALKLEPKNLFYTDSLAWVFFKLGRTEDALKLMEEAASTRDPEVLIHLARVRQANAQEREAWNTYFEARFELNARNQKSAARLERALKETRDTLNPKQRPSLIEVLSRSASKLEAFSGVYRCAWKLTGQELRTKMALEQKPGETLKVLFWAPGAMAAVGFEDLAHMLPPKKEFFEQLEGALVEFFNKKSWAYPPSEKKVRWKAQNDDVLTFLAPRLELEFEKFYFLENRAIAPRFIKIRSSGIESQCETLGYKTEKKFESKGP